MIVQFISDFDHVVDPELTIAYRAGHDVEVEEEFGDFLIDQGFALFLDEGE